MPFGAVAANRLALALPRTQPLDHRRPDEEGDGERRDHRAAAAKGEVAEQVEQRDAVGERDEQVVEHAARVPTVRRSEEHTSELQSLMRISYAVFCLTKKKIRQKMIT